MRRVCVFGREVVRVVAVVSKVLLDGEERGVTLAWAALNRGVDLS